MAEDVGKTADGTQFLKLKPGYKVFANTAEDGTKTISLSRYNGKDAEGKDQYVALRLSAEDLARVNDFGVKWLK